MHLLKTNYGPAAAPLQACAASTLTRFDTRDLRGLKCMLVRRPDASAMRQAQQSLPGQKIRWQQRKDDLSALCVADQTTPTWATRAGWQIAGSAITCCRETQQQIGRYPGVPGAGEQVHTSTRPSRMRATERNATGARR